MPRAHKAHAARESVYIEDRGGIQLMSGKSSTNERLIGLLEYIEQVEKLKKTAPLKVPDEFFRAFQEELRGLPGLEFNLVSGGDDVWARLARLKEDAPPEPSAGIKDWVTITKSPDRLPELKSEITRVNDKGDETKFKLESFPEVRALFEKYVRERWTPWSEREKPRRRSIALYNKLFALHQTMATDGSDSALELIWGMGVALWRTQGKTLEYPLLAQSCEISLNTLNFDLEIRPRDLDPVLELDAYAALEVDGVIPTEAFWRAHKGSMENRPSPFEAVSTAPILRAAVGYLDPSGQFAEKGPTGERQAPTETLTVTDTWVVFARRRAAHVFLQDIERLKKRLASGAEVPAALSSFVSSGSLEVTSRDRITFRGLSSSVAGESVRELYFPMPYNAEQVSIIEKLERGDGVVVQGPPGTGKTHTIANIICHHLAQGKRVLVTAKGEEALKVLQEKIPQDVRPLSVALLSSEREGMKQFEHAIQTIAARVANLSPVNVQSEINAHEARLHQLHESIAALDHRIGRLAEAQLERIRYEERDISPEQLARLVLEQEPLHGWLTDPLDPKRHQPTFSSEDISALRDARGLVRHDLCYLSCTLPRSQALPTAETLLKLHQDLVRAKRMDQAVEQGNLVPLIDTTAATFQRAERLSELLTAAQALDEALTVKGRPWESSLREAIRAKHRLVPQILAVARAVVDEEAQRQARLARPIAITTNAELNEDVVEGLTRLAAGRSAFTLPFGRKDARAILDAVTVAGVKPDEPNDWAAVVDEVEFRVRARRHVAAWNALAPELGLPAAEGEGVAAFRQAAADAEHVLSIERLTREYEEPAAKELLAVFGAINLRRFGTGAAVIRDAALECLATHLDKGRLSYAMNQVGEVLQQLAGTSGKIIEDIRTLLERRLGDASYADTDLASNWRELRERLDALAGLEPAFAVIDRVAGAIESSGAPLWAARLRTEPLIGESDALAPSTWLEAWRWRGYATLLEGLEGHAELKTLFDRRKTQEGDLAKAYRDLIAAKTWLAVHRNSPDGVRQELQRYLNAMQAMGAGTGVRAERHRQTARSAMTKAYPAVPCWILPTWRVSETIPAEVGLFDLVVIDEASQADIWALPALLRGKKLLVVGDHKQVSPSAVGVAEEKVKELVARYLREQVHGSEMTPDKSIYDLARVVYAGNAVMLREHFRCVPAIIEYSKREFYEHEIKPLRIPKRSERLDPPLIDVFISGGYRRGDVNEPEAQAILKEVLAIIDDPAMDKRSIGVISLLGVDQAKRIDDLVRRHVSPKDIIERSIRVGPPPVFQGREADIMLLSMVIQKGDRGAPGRLEMQQRFNVAASRARDRMILFRSVEERDLNPDSLNAQLIRHFRQPFHQDAQQVKALRDFCESDFEREMFDVLAGKGYRLRPQVKVGGYRIDLVVEGAEDRRLAIECDGDRFHGPGQWADDMTRQRTLERAGWTFWRCFASSFVLRRQQVLDDLFGTLARMGITPLGSESVDNTPWVATRVIDPCGIGDEEDGDAAEPPSVHGGATSEAAESSPPPELDGTITSARSTVGRRADVSHGAGQIETEGPVQAVAFADAAVAPFVRQYGLRSMDNRSKGGALWVSGHINRDAAAQLRRWGFQFAAKKGWWKK